jgi:hypothetical protein
MWLGPRLRLVFVAAAAVTERDSQSIPTGLITLTVNEFRQFFDAGLLTTQDSYTNEDLIGYGRGQVGDQDLRYGSHHNEIHPLPT